MNNLIVYNAKEKNNELLQSDLFQNLLKDFESFLDVAPLTVKSYKSGVKRFLAFMAENGIKNPTHETVINFKKFLLDEGRKTTTIALYLSSIKRFFAWCSKLGLYSDIARDVKAPKIAKGHKKDYFAGSQVKAILKSVDKSSREGVRNYALIALMTSCGLRTIEISRAKIEDLRTVGGVPVLYVQGKGRTEKADFVKIPEQVENAIREYLKLRGQSLTTRTISGIAKSAMKEAGFNSSRLTAHSLRHTAVTLSLLAGQSLPDVQAFARHSSINTTMIYNHAVNRIKSECENLIANEIF